MLPLLHENPIRGTLAGLFPVGRDRRKMGHTSWRL